MADKNVLTTPGTFVVGANYWASHAGTAMWSDWQPDVVDADLKQLAEEGLQVLRVFPLWPDFQPLTQLCGGQGRPVELRFGEDPLPDTPAGRAGVSEEMMERFRFLADRAEAHGLKLLVGLVTGWMSGRLFVPPAFEHLNVLTDPKAIMWQVRFVRYFVGEFKDHPAVLAWDLGNECNVMGAVDREAAYVWTATIANTIRMADPTRPIVSGMHSLQPDRRADWRIQDQAELTDVLTTHPYPIFTPHCDQDPINTIRNGLHATSQTCWYADIGGVPAIAEELGTLGPFVCSERVAAAYVRMVLPSLWAHDNHGLLWWCAFDQKELIRAPYDWDPYERELGLIRENRDVKPVMEEIGRFRRWLEDQGIATLPQRTIEAVCILSEGQDAWGAAYSSFILAKQAGFDVEYQFGDQPLKDADLYLVPSVSGSRYFSKRFWLALLDRAKAGATVYVSHKDAMFVPFVEHFELEVVTRERRTGPTTVAFDGIDGLDTLTLEGPIRLNLRTTSAPAATDAVAATRAEVVGHEAGLNPVLTRTRYGEGELIFLSLPLETYLAETPGAFHGPRDVDGPEPQPFWRIYAHIAAQQIASRVVRKAHPMVGVTEHPEGEARRLVVLINYSPHEARTPLTLAQGWSVVEALMGSAPVDGELTIPPNDAVVLRIGR